MIGVVGGVGPYAGLDLMRKIFDQTRAVPDQDHLPVAMLSVPHRIADRTAYVLGETETNPGLAIAEIVARLATLGAEVIGIPCNTAHVPAIFDCIRAGVEPLSGMILLHMIEEVASYLGQAHPGARRVGVISTTGTFKTKLYPELMSKQGIEVIQVPEEVQARNVQPAIYDSEYGIKVNASPVSTWATEKLRKAVDYLVQQGAEAIILGCTELPLAIPDREMKGVPVVDPAWVLARALIRHAAPSALQEEP